MKLYILKGSANCRKVLATSYALNLPLTVIRLDGAAGDLKKPDFLQLNPNGMVPVLDDDGFVLWESNAIMQYLAMTKPAQILFPDDAKMRANIYRWQLWEASHLSKTTGALLRENVLKKLLMNAEPDASAVEKATADFHRFAAVLEEHLSTRRFLLGYAPTLADFSVAANFTHVQTAQIPWDQYTAIQEWYGRMEMEPAYKRSETFGE